MFRLVTRSLFSIALFMGFAAGTISTAQAQAAQVNLSIVESYCPGGQAEKASATWSSDPAAVITVTRDPNAAAGEVWLIDLTNSGHQVPGANWPSGFMTATWVEPEHTGLFNNLYIVDPQHLRLESEQEVGTGDNMPGNCGAVCTWDTGFGNGVSFYAGLDLNGDAVYPQITETALDENDPVCKLEDVEAKLDAIEAKLDNLSQRSLAPGHSGDTGKPGD